MRLLSATFELDPKEPEDYQIIVEMQATQTFRWDGQVFEATSVRTSRNGVKVTAKALR